MTNREKERESARRYYAGHREKIIKRAHEYYQSHKEQARASVRKYHAAHVDEHREQGLRWSRAHPEQRREYSRKYREEHRDDQKKHAREAMYGVSREHYSRLLAEQDGKCAICNGEMKHPHIDHDHQTGKVRGLLCKKCNSLLGFACEDTAILRAALSYLGREPDSVGNYQQVLFMVKR